MACGPVHDRDQIQEAAAHRNVGDVGAPDLVGPVDCQPLEKVGINPMRRGVARWSSAADRWPEDPSTA